MSKLEERQNMKFGFQMVTNVEVPARELSWVLIGAIETGFGWFGWPTNGGGRGMTIDEYFLEDGYIDLPYLDPKTDEWSKGAITIDAMVDAVKQYFTLRGISSWEQYEHIQDAATDDSILQIATFGEVIYG